MCDASVRAGQPPARMNRPALELADIVRVHGEAYQQCHQVTPTERAVLQAIVRCRTAALGGHVDVCTACGNEQPSYNSCRNRHCPKCQALAQAKWVAGRLERILPTHYFHVVFTLPAELRNLARHGSTVLDLLFRTAADTLLELGRDPERLGAELGVTMVLHTWARDLRRHYHVHCIVTGGGLAQDDEHWISSRAQYLFPVQVMRELFRGKMLDALRHAHERGQLGTTDPQCFARLLSELYRKNWVVYCKRPFGGPEQVIRYLGQYTHRIGISNHRLVSMNDGAVTFRTKNGKTVTLDANEFLGRFLSHVLPDGFVKIRHYGLMAPSNVTTRLQVARDAITQQRLDEVSAQASPRPIPIALFADWREALRALTGVDLAVCPVCGAYAVQRYPLGKLDTGARAPPLAA